MALDDVNAIIPFQRAEVDYAAFSADGSKVVLGAVNVNAARQYSVQALASPSNEGNQPIGQTRLTFSGSSPETLADISGNIYRAGNNMGTNYIRRYFAGDTAAGQLLAFTGRGFSVPTAFILTENSDGFDFDSTSDDSIPITGISMKFRVAIEEGLSAEYTGRVFSVAVTESVVAVAYNSDLNYGVSGHQAELLVFHACTLQAPIVQALGGTERFFVRIPSDGHIVTGKGGNVAEAITAYAVSDAYTLVQVAQLTPTITVDSEGDTYEVLGALYFSGLNTFVVLWRNATDGTPNNYYMSQYRESTGFLFSTPVGTHTDGLRQMLTVELFGVDDETVSAGIVYSNRNGDDVGDTAPVKMTATSVYYGLG